MLGCGTPKFKTILSFLLSPSSWCCKAEDALSSFYRIQTRLSIVILITYTISSAHFRFNCFGSPSSYPTTVSDLMSTFVSLFYYSLPLDETKSNQLILHTSIYIGLLLEPLSFVLLFQLARNWYQSNHSLSLLHYAYKIYLKSGPSFSTPAEEVPSDFSTMPYFASSFLFSRARRVLNTIARKPLKSMNAAQVHIPSR